MSLAPDTLINLRRYLRAKTGKPAENFSIRASCCYGYHLGRADLERLGRLGNPKTDYSIRRRRDRNPTNAAAAIDLTLPKLQMVALVMYLVSEAKAGRIPDLVEVIGLAADGRAYDWRKPTWEPIGPRPKGDAHQNHAHTSWHRDSENREKVPFFVGFFGPPDVALPPDEPPQVEEPDEPTEPPKPTYEELEAANAALEAENAAQDAALVALKSAVSAARSALEAVPIEGTP